jgi:hypothetical protein
MSKVETGNHWKSLDYDIHGHVGFAWGIRRSILDAVGGLYDRALIGDADHIMAHACVYQEPASNIAGVHRCISNCHIDPAELKNIQKWSADFLKLCDSKLGFIQGDIHHDWHGDLKDRHYYQRIYEFSPFIKETTQRDANGLYITTNPRIIGYVTSYFTKREVRSGSSVLNNQSRHEPGTNSRNHKSDNRNAINQKVSHGNDYYNHLQNVMDRRREEEREKRFDAMLQDYILRCNLQAQMQYMSGQGTYTGFQYIPVIPNSVMY